MPKTVTLRAQIDPELKESVDTILKKMGISTSQAISTFYHAIKHNRGIPGDLKVPNRKTRRAMRDAERGHNLKEWHSKEEFFKALEEL